MQTDNTLILFARTHEDNLRGAYAATCQILTFYLNLIAWNQGYTAPQDDLCAEEVGGDRGHTAPSTLTLEGGDGTRMGHEESRLLPNEAQQFVEVVRGW